MPLNFTELEEKIDALVALKERIKADYLEMKQLIADLQEAVGETPIFQAKIDALASKLDASIAVLEESENSWPVSAPPVSE